MAKAYYTRSGVIGWRGPLRTVYASFEEFKSYCDIYNNHKRLGYKTPESAWRYNPTIEGSTNPSDYCKVLKSGRRVYSK
jgi:hypothetical protein